MRAEIRKVLDARMGGEKQRSTYTESVAYKGVLGDALDACRILGRDDELVYFVQCGDFVKIGRTKNLPETRIAAFATGSPFEYQVMASVKGGSRLENTLHHIFRSYRRKGEWFRLEGELSRFIKIVDKLSFPPGGSGYGAIRSDFSKLSLLQTCQ